MHLNAAINLLNTSQPTKPATMSCLPPPAANALSKVYMCRFVLGVHRRQRRVYIVQGEHDKTPAVQPDQIRSNREGAAALADRSLRLKVVTVAQDVTVLQLRSVHLAGPRLWQVAAGKARRLVGCVLRVQ